MVFEDGVPGVHRDAGSDRADARREDVLRGAEAARTAGAAAAGVRAEPAGSLSGSAQIAVTNEAEMIKLTYLVPVTLLVLAGAIFVLLLADSGRPVRKKGGRRLEEKQAR